MRKPRSFPQEDSLLFSLRLCIAPCLCDQVLKQAWQISHNVIQNWQMNWFGGFVASIVIVTDEMQELLVCQEAAQPVLDAISKLEQSMGIIEEAVTQLELDSARAMLQLGLTTETKR